jgi:hypothetical protein
VLDGNRFSFNNDYHLKGSQEDIRRHMDNDADLKDTLDYFSQRSREHKSFIDHPVSLKDDDDIYTTRQKFIQTAFNHMLTSDFRVKELRDYLVKKAGAGTRREKISLPSITTRSANRFFTRYNIGYSPSSFTAELMGESTRGSDSNLVEFMQKLFDSEDFQNLVEHPNYAQFNDGFTDSDDILSNSRFTMDNYDKTSLHDLPDDDPVFVGTTNIKQYDEIENRHQNIDKRLVSAILRLDKKENFLGGEIVESDGNVVLI